jgi:hypothetical protein
MTTLDPIAAGGFIRMPKAWLTLSISPQAKMLLVAFCGYADPKGRSWFSYEQLGEILNRSKGSIASYVSELRESGVITCRKQTYGNGYNYRLLITVKGWGTIIDAWSGMSKSKVEKTKSASAAPRSATQTSTQDTERSIQPAVRKDPKGPITNIHKTHTPRPAARVEWTMKNEEDWHSFRPSDRDPISSAFGSPDADLLRKTIEVSRQARENLGYGSNDHIKARTRQMLSEFIGDRRLSPDDEQISDAATAISSVALTDAAVEAAFRALGEAWRPHWRRLSTPAQITKTIEAAVDAALPPKEDRVFAGRFMSRAYVAEHHLKRLEESKARWAA